MSTALLVLNLASWQFRYPAPHRPL